VHKFSDDAGGTAGEFISAAVTSLFGTQEGTQNGLNACQ
jgi:hypothetical protein